MASSSRGGDGVNELIVELPKAKSATEVFSLFADKVHTIFEGLKHVSLLLLPGEAMQGSGQTAAPAPGNSKATGKAAAGKAGAGGSGAAAALKGAAQAQATSSIFDATAGICNQQGTNAGLAALDWSNCCVFNLYASRGPVVQAPPTWPVACTATCYAAASARDVVVTADYAAKGPHFLDWKALAEQGCVSMAAVPLFSCNRPVAVLCLASTKAGAFDSVATLKLLGGLLAPYCSLLTYSTRVTEMRRLVNEVITPIAAQLAQQKHSQLAKLGCTVEEAPPGTVPADGKGISVAVGSHGRGGNNTGTNSSNSSGSGNGSSNGPALGQHDSTCGTSSSIAGTEALTAGAANGTGVASSLRQRKGCGSKGSSTAGSISSKAGGKANGMVMADPTGSKGWTTVAAGGAGQGMSHHRFESVVVKGGSGYESDCYDNPTDMSLDCSDFFFNLVSMAIVYVYFSKAAVAGESMVAVLLCCGVAAFDVLLLVMRWLWFEQYINYGGLVMTLFQAYRVVVLPIANTWMSWSLLHKMSITPSGPLIALLGAILLGCIVMGLQVRFFLHAPLQLASVLFAAMSTPDICGAFFQSTTNIRCIGIISALQLSLGLVLPSLCVYFMEGRTGRSFLPHAQVKPELKYTFAALSQH